MKSRPGKKNGKHKMESNGYPVAAYSYSFPPSSICPQPERYPVNKLVLWNASGIQNLDTLAWLNLHNHGWEYFELLHNNIMEEITKLMFRLFGKEAVRLWIDYLNEDLKMNPTYNVRKFLCLLKCFSETQLLYLKISNDKEFGCLFSNSSKKQILWNYAFKLLKDEIYNMSKT